MTDVSGPEAPGLHLFEGYGIELEYMIVRSDDLGVYPVSDRLLGAGTGRVQGEIERGDLAWSNELVLHVLEMKTNGPSPKLAGLDERFAAEVRAANRLLAPLGGRLMPTAMHPFMNPGAETRLWPHEYGEIYRMYDRIFACTGHGWSNLQSAHINLPFSGDSEFAALHAAIRCVLPLVPAIAASSPLADGQPTGVMDTRLVYYQRNQRLVPTITGGVIPERVYSRAAYQSAILDRIAADIARWDSRGILDPEWVNSRGAIARFVRDSIEIRLLDLQESPRADLSVIGLVIAAVRALVEERWSSIDRVAEIHESRLRPILDGAIAQGGHTVVEDIEYLGAFGLGGAPITVRDIWAHLLDSLPLEVEDGPLQLILSEGTLAERILRALSGDYRRAAVQGVYGRLCDCLASNELFSVA